MLKLKTKKILSLIVLITLLSTSFSFINIKQTNATGIPVVDVALIGITQGEIIPILSGNLPGTAQKEGGLFGIGYDGIAYFAARILVRQLTQSIVDWINSGFQGNPAFIQDPAGFIAKDIDRTIGNFIQNSALSFLCEPFQLNIKLALGLQYSPFKDRIGCQLTDIINNTNNAYNNFANGDFVNGGGWDTWLAVTTVPQNDQIGALLIAQGELDAQINNQSLLRDKELSWSGGFLSMKQCSKTQKDLNGNIISKETYNGDPGFYLFSKPGTQTGPSSNRNLYLDGGANRTNVYQGTVEEKCELVTPGALISDQMKKSTGLDMDALNMADEINEIVGALANFVITKAMQKGFSTLNKEELSANDASWRQGLESLKSQQYGSFAGGSNSYNLPTYTDNNFENPNNFYDQGGTPDPTLESQLADAKNNLLSYLSSYEATESDYYNRFSLIYTQINDVLDLYDSALDCYNRIIDDANGTNNQVNQTQSDPNTASSTRSEVKLIQDEILPGLLISEGNLNAMTNITEAVNSAYTLEEVQDEAYKFSSILPRVHLWTPEEQTLASTTEVTISEKLTEAENTAENCELLAN